MTFSGSHPNDARVSGPPAITGSAAPGSRGSCSAAIFALYSLQQIRGLERVIESARFLLRHPDPDEVRRNIAASCQTLKGFAAEELLDYLALELNAVAAVSGHGLPLRMN